MPVPFLIVLALTPVDFTLHDAEDCQRLVVTSLVQGRFTDVTKQSRFTTGDPKVARVSPEGMVRPVGPGTTTITATFGEATSQSRVTVLGVQPRTVTFEKDILPLLTRHGCNSGPCHGKARGQNGFALSLLSYDADFDFQAMVREGRGRRVFPSAPEQSLLLRKAAGETAHGGGKRLEVGTPAYETMKRWIASGMPRTPQDTPQLERIVLTPGERILAPRGELQLLVTAQFSNGQTADVTHLASFQSNESAIATVGADGLVRAGPVPGEAAVMARYMEKFAVCHLAIPRPGSVPHEVYDQLPRYNFVDGHIWNRLARLSITPSEAANDATFLRRVHLDILGRLPTPEEVRDYLADTRSDKRSRKIDQLLERPEYADFWANKWADLLRPNPYRVGIKAVYNLDAWLRDAFRKNLPYDRFVRELITARGSTFRNGATVLFRDRREPDEITTLVSQLFLGVRLECARCHHHPFEIWGQDDFYSLAAYFGRVGRKGVGLSPPISGGEEFVFAGTRGEVRHPVTGKVLPPRPLGGSPVKLDDESDPREVLADWITSPDNPYFARVMVNRVWADLMGRGLVEPVDDLRATNPPSNGPLLDALAAEFRRQKYDVKALIRTITSSYAYGLSSRPNERNLGDTRQHSRHYRHRLRAEVLLDALTDITQIPETFAAAPLGTRAIELWTVRTQSVFLDSFGRPDPNQDPPCERTSDTTVVQALHLMNAPGVHRKVTSDDGRAARLAGSQLSNGQIVDELYLLVYGRFPDHEERSIALKLFMEPGAKRRLATEDLLWALINTPEFVFKD